MAVLNEELAAVAASLSRSTVQVQSRRSGGGSGVIWDSNGLIITNAHVVRGMGARVELSDKRVFDAVCVKRDRSLDLAILKVDATDLPAATIGNDALRVGELVLAVGNPLGAVGALTTGIIHAESRGVFRDGVALRGLTSPPSPPELERVASGIIPPRVEGEEASSPSHSTAISRFKTAVSPLNTANKWVQADIRLAPGNSGGPLADAQGRVIGINTVIVGGLALAVPSNTVERFIRQERSRPYLGVTLQPVIISQLGRRGYGFLLLEVEQGPAQTAGLLIGDVLIGVTGKFFRTTADLAQALWQTNPGEALQLDFLRGGKYMTCTVRMPDGKTSAEAA